MGTDPPDIGAARALVAKALSLSVHCVGSETKMFGLPAWDSFGQLSVVLVIEEELGTRVEDEVTFNRLTSVPDIAAYLTEVAAQTFRGHRFHKTDPEG